MIWWSNGIGWGWGDWGTWTLMTLAMVAFWVVVAFGVIALFRSGRQEGQPLARPSENGAERILDEAFARGEIDAQEYQARKTVLHSVH